MNTTKLKIVLLLLIPGFLFSRELTATSMAKLSPDLQALVAEMSPENAALTQNRYSKVQTVSSTMRETLYPVTIRSEHIESVKSAGIKTNSDYEGWSTARVTYDELLTLSELNSVSSVFQGDVLYPLNDLAVSLSGADLIHDAYLNDIAYDGTGVIILVIDTGIDWSHLDFRGEGADTVNSRILYIWDQTITANEDGATGEVTPDGYDGTNFEDLDYGVHYTQAHIEDEIDGIAANYVREEDTNGHGTMVTSAAAGSGAALTSYKYKGLAPNADIVVVKAGNGTLSDNNVKDALTYAQGVAAKTSKPVVANLSLGGQTNAHDGTSTLDQAVNTFTGSGNGRVAVVAAGNAGNEDIHVSGSVGASSNSDFTVNATVGGAGSDYFVFELWWDGTPDVTLTVISPNSDTYSVAAGQTGTSTTGDTNDGIIYLFNNTDSNFSNGDRRSYVRVYEDGTTPMVGGNWTIRATNNTGSSIDYHGWLSARYYSTTTVSGGDSDYTIATPGTASSAITVGGYTARWRWHATNDTSYGFLGTDLSDDIAYFSSVGPTRDGAQKPDICTPGRGVIAATSSDYTPYTSKTIAANTYHLNEGTSIGAGAVSGAVSLLLDYNPNLSAASVKSLLTDNADSDATYTGSVPNYSWGYGKLNIFKSMAKAINSAVTVNHDVYSYFGWGATAGVSLPVGYYASQQFYPTVDGDVTGAFFHPSSSTGTADSVYFEIWSDNSTEPGAKLGSTVKLAVSDISKYSWNYVSLKDTGVPVTGGSYYHLMLINEASGSFGIHFESGSNNGKSHYSSSGSSWTGYSNWRMRTVVSTNEETLDSSLPVELAFFNASTYKGHIVLKWATESETENQGFRIDRRISGQDEWKTIADHGKNPELEGQGSTTSRTDYSFKDKTAKPGVKYDYRLSDIPYAAAYKANPIILEDVQLLIEKFVLYDNYPNPFNPSTQIAYQMPQTGDVSIRITDIKGREVQSWTLNDQAAGYHEARWGGLNNQGAPVSAGVYLLTVQAGNVTQSRKMLLLK